MYRRSFLALPLITLAQPAFATDLAGASAFVKTLLTDVLVLVNGNVAGKEAKLQAAIDANVDMAAIAQFCIGRFWRTATPAQQSEYTALFHKVLTKNILGRVGEFQGTSFEMGNAVAREGAIGVITTLNRPNNAPNKVEWIINESGPPKVIDVIAEGTSLRLTQRSDYTAFIGRNNNNLQALIDAMKAQTSN